MEQPKSLRTLTLVVAALFVLGVLAAIVGLATDSGAAVASGGTTVGLAIVGLIAYLAVDAIVEAIERSRPGNDETPDISSGA